MRRAFQSRKICVNSRISSCCRTFLTFYIHGAHWLTRPQQVPLLHLQDYLLDLQHYHKAHFSSRRDEGSNHLLFCFCSSPRAMRNQNKWLFSQQVIALHLAFCGFHAAFGSQFETCTTVKSFENAEIKKIAMNVVQLMQIRGVSFWIANRLSNKF